MESTAPLSPAAQAVYEAAQEVSWDWSSMTEAHFSVIVAAALRAAADQVLEEVSPVEAILTLASELERSV